LAAEEGQSAARVAGLARGAEVVFLGEQHDNPAHHDGQARVLEALVTAGARPAVAFEMLDAEQQAAVDQALAEGLSGAALEERLGWRARGRGGLPDGPAVLVAAPRLGVARLPLERPRPVAP